MAVNHDLRLHEEILLLALKDDKGTPVMGMYAHAMAGGVLTELMLEERVALAERKRGKPLVEVVSATQVGDRTIDGALRQLRTAKRRATAETWIGRWARTKLMHDTARQLGHKGILRVQQKDILLVFKRTVYPALDPDPERRLVERIRGAVFGDDEVDARTAAVAVLADAAGLLTPVFGRKELKARKGRLKALAEGQAGADAARAAIQAVQAAVVAATAAAVTTAST